MLEIIFTILKNKTAATIIGALAAVLILGGIFAYLTHERHKAEIEANRQKQEAQRLQEQNKGLEILINANTQAQEIEKLKDKANAQDQNSNISNADFYNSVRRDSNSFSGNFDTTKKRFCRNFPDDSKCR